MAWPQGVLGNKFELYYDGQWNNHTSDVRGLGAEDGEIEIGPRGQPEEATSVNATVAKLSVNNADGKYSPRNTLSTLYGKIGLNTQARISTDVSSTVDIEDSFDTDGSSGWPVSDSGHTWTTTGGTASDYSVASGVAIHAHQAANVTHAAMVQSTLDGDSLEITDFNMLIEGITVEALPTGANVEVGVKGRVIGTSYVEARIAFTTGNAVQVRIVSVLSGVSTTTADVPLSGAVATDAISIRFQAKGYTLRVRIWETANEEPSTWDTTLDATHITPGYVEINSICLTGNSNAKPFDVSFGSVHFSLGIILFTGEVSGWPKRWDLTGNDVWIPLEISGVTRRLRQGDRPLRSALYRAMTGVLATGDVYWSFERLSEQPQLTYGTGANRDGIPSGVLAPLGGFIRLTLGPQKDIKIDLSSDSTLHGSDALPVIGNTVNEARSMSFRTAIINTELTANQFSVCFWVKGSGLSATDAGAAVYLAITPRGAGTALSNTVEYNTSWIHSHDGTSELTTVESRQVATDGAFGPVGDDLTAADFPASIWHFVRYTWTDPSNIEPAVYVDEVEIDTGSFSGSIGRPVEIVLYVTTYEGSGTISLGHVAIASGVDGDAIADNAETIFAAGHGHAGEDVRTRFARICTELNVPYEIIDSTLDDDEPTLCGPQKSLNPVALLAQTVAVDDGLFYELRDDVGYGFRTMKSMYRAASALTLDYSAADLVEVPETTDDDLELINIVGAKRDGSEELVVRADTGPNTPELVGDYEAGGLQVAAISDAQLLDFAAMRVYLGSWDDSRWPGITVAMHRENFAGNKTQLAAAAFLEIGQVFTLINNPVWLGPDDVLFQLRAVSVFLSNFAWSFGYSTRPGAPFAALNEIDNPNYGRVDTDTCSLFAAVDSDDTELLVVTELTEDRYDTPLRTTDAGELDIHNATGIDFRINAASRSGGLGGEQVRTGQEYTVSDAFNRSASQLGGSTADTGQTWVHETGTATDATLNGTQLRQTHPSANTQIWTSIPVGSPDMCVSVDIAFSVTTATGANLEADTVVRHTQGTTANNYRARLTLVSGTSNLTLSLHKNISGSVSQLGATYTLGTNTADVPWRVKIAVSGTTLMAKAWLVSASEPDWQIVVLGAATEVFSTSAALRSSRLTGNTNANATTIWDNFTVHALTITPMFYDYFARTVADGVGVSNQGGTWVDFWSGAYTSGDISVAPNRIATIIPVATTYRGGYLDGDGAYEIMDGVVSMTWTCPLPTGGDMEPGDVIMRGENINSYIQFRPVVTTAAAIVLRIYDRVPSGETLLGEYTLPFAFSASVPLRTKAACVGDSLYMKVWDPTLNEPPYWQLKATDPTPIAGFVGYRNGRGFGNTNVNPTPTISDFKLENPQRIVVARGINNAARAWDAESDFRLWTPLRLGR